MVGRGGRRGLTDSGAEAALSIHVTQTGAGVLFREAHVEILAFEETFRGKIRVVLIGLSPSGSNQRTGMAKSSEATSSRPMVPAVAGCMRDPVELAPPALAAVSRGLSIVDNGM